MDIKNKLFEKEQDDAALRDYAAGLPVNKTAEGYPFYQAEPPKTHLPVAMPTTPEQFVSELTGGNGRERVQFWPEKMVRSGLSLASDVASGQEPIRDQDNRINQRVIERAGDMAGLAFPGTLAMKPGIASLTSGMKKMATNEADNVVYHGTSKPGFERFETPESGQYMPDRGLGIHVAKDPAISETFVKDSGGIYPLKVPKDSKFFEINQELLPYITDKATVKNSKNVSSDQNAVEHAIYKVAYRQDPEMFQRFLKQRWNMTEADAKTAATAILNNKPYRNELMGGLGREIKGLDDYVKMDGVVKAWNEADRAKAIEFFKKDLQDKGFVGVKYINTSPMETANAKDPTSYIVFDPHKHIKSKITDTLMSDTGTPGTAIAAVRNAPTFFSSVEQAVKNAKMNTGTTEQWQGYLKNQPGIKAEELSWSGLDNLPKGQITKEALEKHVAENGVKLEEVWKGSPPKVEQYIEDTAKLLGESVYAVKTKKDLDDAKRFNIHFRETVKHYNLSDEALINEIIPAAQKHREELKKYAKIGETKHHTYQLPGGENYREVIFTLPKIKYEDKGHWPGIEGNIFWVRMNDRTIPNIGKSLHIEEIQSKLHQEGRKEGYKLSKEQKDKLEPEFNRIDDKIINSGNEEVMSHPDLREAVKMAVDKGIITKAEADIYNKYSDSERLGAVPDAPFKSTWSDVAIKRMIREASEKGYDAISWTPGEAQAARYDLSKQVDKINWEPSQLNNYSLVKIKPKGDSKAISLQVDKNGKVDSSFPYSRGHQFEGKTLSDIVGKEMAEKINAAKAGSLEGEGLSIGGEGMKGFYDKMVVDKVNSITKKFGGKVEQQNLKIAKESELIKKLKENNYNPDTVDIQQILVDNGGRKPSWITDKELEMIEAGKHLEFQGIKSDPIHILKLTPELRKHAIEKGFPLFEGAPNLIPVDHNPFDLDKKSFNADKSLGGKKPVKLIPVFHNPFEL